MNGAGPDRYPHEKELSRFERFLLFARKDETKRWFDVAEKLNLVVTSAPGATTYTLIQPPNGDGVAIALLLDASEARSVMQILGGDPSGFHTIETMPSALSRLLGGRPETRTAVSDVLFVRRRMDGTRFVIRGRADWGFHGPQSIAITAAEAAKLVEALSMVGVPG